MRPRTRRGAQDQLVVNLQPLLAGSFALIWPRSRGPEEEPVVQPVVQP